MVLMTDGVNVFGGDDAKTQALCDAIKAEGITIYTVGFGQDGVNTTLLTNCASQPSYYFFAPTSADLQTVFHQIGDNIVYNTQYLSQ